MKKIMFNDRYGLTKAVLEGRKTMTRRVIKAPRTMDGKDVYGFSVISYRNGEIVEVMAVDEDGAMINNILPKYKPGEVVAVAQSYEDIVCTELYGDEYVGDKLNLAGWDNKMFVRANLMPHQIRITNVRVERLQDISDEDCLNEGIKFYNCGIDFGYKADGVRGTFGTAREAFAALIDKVSGEGTWQSNPWVFVYEFELYKEGRI